MGTQQQRLALRILALDVEGILHRTRRVIFRAIQCGEIGPVVFDFRTVGHIKADRTENFFDALP
ncbi:hypothetical protein D3C81_1902210 [compost metagenome]